MPIGREHTVSEIKRLVLDVLKPHTPSIVELSRKLGKLVGVLGVNCSVNEVDKDTESIKITIEGHSINFDKVTGTIEAMGAVIHSVDSVSAGKKIVEEVETPQDR
jgi:hypothetical protein